MHFLILSLSKDEETLDVEFLHTLERRRPQASGGSARGNSSTYLK
jgi:hypothetical protein